MKIRIIFIFLFLCLLQSCAPFQTPPVTLTENAVIHQQHARLQKKAASQFIPLHEEWQKTWALEDKWDENTSFLSKRQETSDKVTESQQAALKSVREQVDESRTFFIVIETNKEVAPPQEKLARVAVEKEETVEEIEPIAPWNLETLVKTTSPQDYQLCPIQSVNLSSIQEDLPTAEAPLSVAQWQQQEIKKILLEFGEHEDFQVPVYFQNQVAKWIARFTQESSQARAWYARALRRMDAYYPTIDTIFSEKQLPTSLYYLALIESGFNPNARSHAGAVGLWQFIPATARRYGLKVGANSDQRTQPEQATLAAREYLHDLILEFGDGHSILLAMAAYNAGENGIRQKLRRLESYRSRNFWTLAEEGLLHAETHDYVPKIFAAAIVGRNRARFGFEASPRRRVNLAYIN